MVSKIAGTVAISSKENVPGVAQMVGAVEKIMLEMDAMAVGDNQTYFVPHPNRNSKTRITQLLSLGGAAISSTVQCVNFIASFGGEV